MEKKFAVETIVDPEQSRKVQQTVLDLFEIGKARGHSAAEFGGILALAAVQMGRAAHSTVDQAVGAMSEMMRLYWRDYDELDQS